MTRKASPLFAVAVLTPALALIFTLAAKAQKKEGLEASRAPGPPRLAVVISVDGLSWPRLRDYKPYFVSGLKRLLDEGHIERETRYRHINTETGPGHASLGTGAPPRVTGIVANRWFQPRPDGSLRVVYCTDQEYQDPESKEPVSIPGPANLRVPTLGDQLIKKFPASRVVSFSGKDRGSIFLAGKDKKHSVYWWDAELGRFTSSRAYDSTSYPGSIVASIVKKYNRTQAQGYLPGRLGLLWKRLTLENWKEPANLGVLDPAPASQIAPHQVPANGLGWDHDLSKNPSGYFGGVYASPLIDELVADLAVLTLNNTDLELGHQETPDILALSFSAQDTVSHNYGSESEENLDVLRRLDVQLGRLFEILDRSFPAGKVILAFSADHGFTPIPEFAKKRDKTYQGGRLSGASFANIGAVDRLNRVISTSLCLEPGSRPIHGTEGWNVRYNSAALPAMKTQEGPCGPAGQPVTARDIDRVLPQAVKALFFEEIQDVFLCSEKENWSGANPATEFVKNDFDAERTGQAILIPRTGVIAHWDPGRGTGHGSQYDADTHVPLIFWGGSIKPHTSDRPATPYDLAPTLGRLLGVEVPDSTGRPLLP